MNFQVVRKDANLNDYIYPGLYQFNSTYDIENIPIGVNGYLKVTGKSTYFVKQIWWRIGTINTNDTNIFVRSGNTSGNWSDWDQIITKKVLNKLLPTVIISTWFDIYLGTLNSNDTNSYSVDITKDGYNPIGIIAHDCSGTQASALNIYEMMTDSSNNTATISVRNIGSSATDSTSYIRIKVLYSII